VITFILGGARSGKSEVGERLAAALPAPMTYLATGARPDPADPDWAARVAAHRRRRPVQWRTVEAGADLVTALGAVDGSVLIDSLGTWVASGNDFSVDGVGLCDVLARRPGDAVVVSEEVGLGVHPSTAVGRDFRDALGALNQEVAAVSDVVLLVVAGRALRLDPI
jgi:adenosylcobinamide kinase/adenosylcobinamide-phosphate guanylyltransferase